MKGLTKLVKRHCKECNGTLKADCQGFSCSLYDYFKKVLLIPILTDSGKN